MSEKSSQIGIQNKVKRGWRSIKIQGSFGRKGYAREYGVDYEEVYTHVARMDTIQMILALAAQRGWCVFQLDVKSTLLHGKLDENVYVEQPRGYEIKNEEKKVYKLNRALYGLKQALRAWFNWIESYFRN